MLVIRLMPLLTGKDKSDLNVTFDIIQVILDGALS